MDLPKDPVMLLSVINMKLRDFYPNIDVLCQEMDLSKEELISSLSSIDYEYDESLNQFV